MKSVPLLTMVMCGLGLLMTPHAAAEDGFKLPNLNPFKRSSSGSSQPAAPAVEKKPFKFPALPSPPSLPKPKLPKLSLPKLELPTGRSNRPPNAPSAWTRFNEGTKDFFAKTKSALMPWADKGPTRPSAATGARMASRSKRPALLPSFFGSVPDEPEINSVNDYLALPRPTP